MPSKRLVHRVAALIVLSVAAVPANASDWSFRLDLLSLAVLGHDPLIATVVEQPVGASSPSSVRSFDLALDSDVAARLRVERRGERWTLHASGMFFDGPDGNLVLGPYTSCCGSTTTLVMEQMGIVATAPPADGGGSLNLDSQDHFYHWTVDLQARRRIAAGERTRTEAVVGLRVGWYADRLFQNLFQLGPGGFGVFQAGEAESDILVGPTLGLRTELAGDRHRLELLLSQTVLIGSVAVSSEITQVGPGAGRVLYRRTTQTAIPVTDLEAAWWFPVGRTLEIGAMLTGSLWWDVPSAPLEVRETGFDGDRTDDLLVGGIGVGVA